MSFGLLDSKSKNPNPKRMKLVAFVAIFAGTTAMGAFISAQSPSTRVAPSANAKEQNSQPASASAHLKHRYSFSSDAKDSIGDAAGKLEGAAQVKDGKLILDGSTGTFVDLPGGLLSGYKAATIEFWISTGQNGNYARIFDAGEISGHSGIKSIYFCVDHTSSGDWRLKISVPDGKDQVVAIKGNLSGRKDLHVVNVLDPVTGFMGIYVNGELVGSRTDLISLKGVSPHYFFIGRSLYSADAYLNASIDEFRIYDSALSPEQVKNDYSAGPNRVP